MTILITEELLPFNISAKCFAGSRFENNRFDFSAVIIFGDTACVITRAHTVMQRASEKLLEDNYCDMTIIDALGCGVKEETGLTVSHVLAFLGSDSSDQVQRLYFLVTVHEPQPSDAMSPRDSISDDILDVKVVMWFERESIGFIERCFKERGIGYEDDSFNGAKSLALLHVLDRAFHIHEVSVVQRSLEQRYHPAQTVQPHSTARNRYLHYDLFNRADIGVVDWQVVDRCLITEFNEYPESVLTAVDKVSPEEQLANLSLFQRVQVDTLLSDMNDELKAMEWSCVYAQQTETTRKALRVLLLGRPRPVGRQKYQRSAMGELVDVYEANQSKLRTLECFL